MKINDTLKIMLGVSSTEGLEKIIKSGVDELYCGYVPQEWQKKYGFFISPNRRAYARSNFKNIGEVAKAVNIARQNNIPLYMALNALFLVKEQYPLIKKIIEQGMEAGIKGFIVADVGLLLALQKMQLDTEIHISTVGVILNSYTLNFYKSLGATRINLERHLTIKEIEFIAKNNPGCELEIFVWGAGCLNIDGLCTYKHGLNILEERVPDCQKRQDWRVEVISKDKPFSLNRKLQTIRRFKAPFKGEACGVCALYDFAKMGINSIKVVKRIGNPLKEQLHCIRFMKSVRDLARDNSLGRENFIKKARFAYKKYMGFECRHSCYYYDESFQ